MDKKLFSRIKETLKANPRGMSVTGIAGAIGKNRQTVAKYMEILVLSGQVDVRYLGTSKVYYLSQRLPVMALLNLTSWFMIVLDANLNVININDHFLEFIQMKREDILYKNLENFAMPLKLNPPIIPCVKSALNGVESTIEAQYMKNGQALYFDIKFLPMVLDDGEHGATIFFYDITERRRIEDERSRFAAIVEASSDAIISTKIDGIITSWNKGAERVYGYRPDEIIGKPVSIFAPQDLPDDIPQIFEKIGHGENIIYYNTKRVRKDGKIIDVSLTVSPLKDNAGKIIGVATIAREVAEFKHTE